MQPIIGITPDFDLSENKYKLHKDYASAIADAGGYPIMLLPQSPLPPFLDGVVFSGGGDIDPLLFDEEPLFQNGEISPLRDKFELALCNTVLQKNMPLLGICRGMQVLNIALGGTIYQDISAQTNSTLKHNQQAPRFHATHGITVLDDTLLSSLLKTTNTTVNSYHHQAVSSLGHDLRVCAKSKDDLIEAIEHTKNPFALGLQWHPEAMKAEEQKSLFIAFIKASQTFHKNRR